MKIIYLTMKIFSHLLSQLILIGILIIDLCLFSPPGVFAEIYSPKINGPHARLRKNNRKGVCANCHTPHKSQGKGAKKLWIQDLQIPQKNSHDTFGGTRALCYSCHNDLSDYDGVHQAYSFNQLEDFVFGGKSVFDPEHRYEDHVMHGAAEYETISWDLKDAFSLRGPYANMIGEDQGDYREGFPVDPDDWDTVPHLEKGNIYDRKNINYQEGQNNRGMYCGTCHNPHYDVNYADNLASPYQSTQGGAYLRPGKLETGVGEWDETPNSENQGYESKSRTEFCKKCHGYYHFDHRDCLECHHPHRGKNLLADNKGNNEGIDEINYLIELTGRKIFSLPLPEWSTDRIFFSAKPNVPRITDRPDEDHFFSSFCYACHSQDGANEGWEEKEHRQFWVRSPVHPGLKIYSKMIMSRIF